MKKPYIEPEFENVRFLLKNEVLFHSEFELYGKNEDWDWNPEDYDIENIEDYVPGN